VYRGCYPKQSLAKRQAWLPHSFEEDLAIISRPLDFFGVNIYTGWLVEPDGNGSWRSSTPPVNLSHNAMGWGVTPSCLYWGPRFYYERYNKPILIAENGYAAHDTPSADGMVHDAGRINYTARYLHELKRAMRDNIPVQGYFHWSLMDNFEWAEGYKPRFGLIYVDYETQCRIVKDSGRWYRTVIESKGVSV